MLHSLVVDESGGLHGVRDRNSLLMLEGLLGQKVFGKELYRGVFTKAAVYTRTIIENHPFTDGNKRTAMLTAGVFFEKNGFRLVAREGEIEQFAVEIAQKKFDLEEIAEWFKQRSATIKSRKM